MRTLTSIILLTGLSASAGAHTLPGDAPVMQQLSHQLTSLHHLPGIVLILIAGGLLVLAAKGWSTRNRP